MPPIKASWKSGIGPVDSGIFLADDTFHPISFLPGRVGIKLEERRPIPHSSDQAEYGDYETGRIVCDAGIVRWGGGPWEGEGWIALEEASGDLVWLMHFEDSEAFTKAWFEAGSIKAVACEYPSKTIYTIQATRPDELTLELIADSS